MFLNFGISPIQNGQRNATTNNEPRLIANSTAGKFQLSGIVTKAMGVANGDSVMFLNNADGITAAFDPKSPQHNEILNLAAELGVDINTTEGRNAVIEKALTYFVAKGIALYDKVGNHQQVAMRLTKEQKIEFVKLHADEILAAKKADEEKYNELIERVGNPDATDEELKAALTVDDATPTEDKYLGSKAASKLVGTGNMVSFTDTNVWMKLKNDLDNKESKNRYFTVHLDSPITFAMNNGHEDVNVTAYPISFDKDVDPIVRGANNDENED